MNTRADFTAAPISGARAIVLGAATVAIIAKMTDPLHGGLGLGLPEPTHTAAETVTLVAAITAAALWVRRYTPSCRRMRALIGRGTRLSGAERLFAAGWVLIGMHAAVAVLG